MSLQIWLPLCGDINNQGLLDITPSLNGIATAYENGKIGKCFVSGSQYIVIPLKTVMPIFSICLWVKPSSPNAWCDVFSFGDKDNRLEVSTTNGYYWYNDTGENAFIQSGSYLFDLTNNVWHHICMTSNGSAVKFYVNGVLTKEFTQQISASIAFGSLLKVTVGARKDGVCKYSGSINDFRLYDHCLSPKEVKEISKGLTCHYPLNDLYCTNSINKYKGDEAEGKSLGGSFTCTKLSDERGYNYKLSYTGNGSNCWHSLYFNYVSFTAGKTYDYSCKVRANSWSNISNFSFRASRMSNDWATSMKNVLRDKGEWKEYHTQLQLGEKSDRSGTSYDTKPLIEFYTQSMVTKDTVYSFDIDIKDIQIAETSGNNPVSFTDGSYPDTTIYDCSGLKNNGNVSNKTYILSDINSPRYDTCYRLISGGNPYIGTPNFAFENMTQGTLSIWINRHSTDSTWRNYLMFANSYNWTGNELDFIIFGSTGSQAIVMDCCSNTYAYTPDLNKWYLYTLTWDFSTKTAKFYINGELKHTATSDRIGTTYASKHGSHFIGNANYTTSDYSLSDFRLYVTALSDADIKELYNTPISLTNTGVLMTQGEFKEV